MAPRVCVIVVEALVLGLQRRAQGIELGRVEGKAGEEGLEEGWVSGVKLGVEMML